MGFLSTKTINRDLIDVDDVKKIISKYTDYRIFMKSEPNLYQKLVKMKRLEEFTKDLKKYIIYWNDEKIDEEVSKYKYLDDFYTNSFGCYTYVKRHKLNHKLINLKYRRKTCSTTWNEEKISKEISKYTYRTDFIKNSRGCYSFIKRHNLDYMMKKLIYKNKGYTQVV